MGDEFYNKVFTALGVTMKEVNVYARYLREAEDE